jgi:hypothetical protein
VTTSQTHYTDPSKQAAHPAHTLVSPGTPAVSALSAVQHPAAPPSTAAKISAGSVDSTFLSYTLELSSGSQSSPNPRAYSHRRGTGPTASCQCNCADHISSTAHVHASIRCDSPSVTPECRIDSAVLRLVGGLLRRRRVSANLFLRVRRGQSGIGRRCGSA